MNARASGRWRAGHSTGSREEPQVHAPAGSSAFSQHRGSGHAAIVVAFVLMLSIEGLAVHLLLLDWSVLAAWISTISTAYAAVWLVGDYRATVLRPILVGDETMLLRAGLRWTVEVPRGAIASIGRDKPPFGKECLNLTFLGTPTRWLTLSEPIVAEGLYGVRRRVRAIGIARGQVALTFVLQVVLITALGIALGGLATLAFARLLPSSVPVAFTPPAIAATVGLLLLTGPAGSSVALRSLLKIEPLAALRLTM